LAGGETSLRRGETSGGWTWADPAATTINAVALAIGVVIGASTLKAKASKAE